MSKESINAIVRAHNLGVFNLNETTEKLAPFFKGKYIKIFREWDENNYTSLMVYALKKFNPNYNNGEHRTNKISFLPFFNVLMHNRYKNTIRDKVRELEREKDLDVRQLKADRDLIEERLDPYHVVSDADSVSSLISHLSENLRIHIKGRGATILIEAFQQMGQGESSIPNIARKMGITKAYIYNNLRWNSKKIKEIVDDYYRGFAHPNPS